MVEADAIRLPRGVRTRKLVAQAAGRVACEEDSGWKPFECDIRCSVSALAGRSTIRPAMGRLATGVVVRSA